MILPYRKDLKEKARILRAGMTDAEQALWFRIRRKQLAGIQFYRQKPVGDFIVDFYAPRAKLVVEVDGAHHMTLDGKKKDFLRTDYLGKFGLTVVRFEDHQVLTETDAVLAEIIIQLEKQVSLLNGASQ